MITQPHTRLQAEVRARGTQEVSGSVNLRPGLPEEGTEEPLMSHHHMGCLLKDVCRRQEERDQKWKQAGVARGLELKRNGRSGCALSQGLGGRHEDSGFYPHCTGKVQSKGMMQFEVCSKRSL